MSRWTASAGLLCCLAMTLIAERSAVAQPQVVARGVAQARRIGDEAALVHLAERIGASGIADCLEHAGRAGRLVCARAARHLEQPWPALPVLGAALRDHDRQVASRAAESMVVILSTMQVHDLGPQEPLPEEAESLLAGLRTLAENRQLSPDIRAQVIAISGALSRLVGAALGVARRALQDPELAVRRAAVAALMGSQEPDDLSALSDAAAGDRDLLVATQAVAGVCEATLGAGVPLPAPVEERLRSLLADQRARQSLMRPVLACLAAGRPAHTATLRQLASRHPNPGTRAEWTALTTDSEP